MTTLLTYKMLSNSEKLQRGEDMPSAKDAIHITEPLWSWAVPWFGDI